jgi:hypothetical protein
MSDETSSGDHVGGHSIANEKDDVLGPSLLGKVPDKPVGRGCLVSIVGQGSLVLSRLIECNSSVGLGGHIDKRRRVRVFRKQV